MARSYRGVRKPSGRAHVGGRESKGRSAMLTPAQLIRTEDIPATVPLPDFLETVEYQLRVGGTTRPEVRFATEPKRITPADGSFALIVRAKGGLHGSRAMCRTWAPNRSQHSSNQCRPGECHGWLQAALVASGVRAQDLAAKYGKHAVDTGRSAEATSRAPHGHGVPVVRDRSR